MDNKLIKELQAAVEEHQAESKQMDDIQKFVNMVRGFYESYVNVGFTEEQSLRLVMVQVNSAFANNGGK